MNRILLYIFYGLCIPNWLLFRWRSKNIRLQQENLLRRILKESAKTSYGRTLSLNKSWTIREYQKNVPMVQYEDISEYITSQRLLDENQICPGPIQCFEPTSGSSGAKKLIPYNTAILKSFAHLFKVWCADLFIHGPSLQRGKIWYSVSPQFAVGDSPSDGFEDDSEYLSGTSRKILKRFLPVDPRLKKVQDSDDYFLILSCYLLSCEDLEAISIWNPSFLIRILEFIDDNKSLIVSTLEQSHYHSQGIDFQFKTHPARLNWLRQEWKHSELWPCLRIISCWDSAHAGMSAEAIRKAFPGVYVQGKGLLSTESAVTIPFVKAQGAVPIFDELFFEFSCEETGTILLLDQLREGKSYELIISQKAGLLRYKTNDRIRVRSFYGTLPILDFIGRSGQVVDLCGEKLQLSRVQDALQQLGYREDFLLLPLQSESVSRYQMVVPTEPNFSAGELDQMLCENHHYHLARKLKQLDSIEYLVDRTMRDTFTRFCMDQKQMKLGDIKSAQLIKSVGEARSFLEYRLNSC